MLVNILESIDDSDEVKKQRITFESDAEQQEMLSELVNTSSDNVLKMLNAGFDLIDLQEKTGEMFGKMLYSILFILI